MLGEYEGDLELELRKPLQPAHHRRLRGSLECLQVASSILGMALIVACIIMLLVGMFALMKIHEDGESFSSPEADNNLPLPNPINTTSFALSPSLPRLKDIQFQVFHGSEAEVGTIWSVEFQPASTEFSTVLFDVNSDGRLDLLVVQVTDRLVQTEYCTDRCKEEFGHTPCQSQVAALDGTDGSILWKTWVEFAPFAVNCNHDLNRDASPDCIFAGRSGSLVAIDVMRNGEVIWVVDPQTTFPIYNFYYPLMIKDFDKDGIMDLIITHGGDISYSPTVEKRSPGIFAVISGSSGQQLSERVTMPDDKETYSSPVLYRIMNAIELIVFGSGGETVSGSLWAVTLESLQSHVDTTQLEEEEKQTQNYVSNKTYLNPRCVSPNEYGPKRPRSSLGTFKHIEEKDDWLARCPVWNNDTQPLWNPYKICVYELVPAGKTGTITPPVIIDYNGDGVKDLLVSQFNDHVMMMDGATASIQWDHHTKDTQSYR